MRCAVSLSFMSFFLFSKRHTNAQISHINISFNSHSLICLPPLFTFISDYIFWLQTTNNLQLIFSYFSWLFFFFFHFYYHWNRIEKNRTKCTKPLPLDKSCTIYWTAMRQPVIMIVTNGETKKHTKMNLPQLMTL